MSTLPPQIQREVEAAERLQQELAQPQPPASEPQPPEPQPAPPPAPAPAEPPAAPAAPVAPEPVQGEEYWKQRFKTLEGMHKQALSVLKDTQTGYQQTQVQLEALRQQPRAEPKPPAALVTADDETKFGADLIDVMRRVVREQAQPFGQQLQHLDAVVRNLAPMAERAEHRAQKTQQQLFDDALAQGVPDWSTVNVDPGWHAWLGEYDPIAGKTRQACLDEAANALDAPRVVALFKAYKSTLPPPPAPTQSAQDLARAELARQVAPSKSSTTTAQPPAKQSYTGSQYAHWTDHRRVHDTQAADLKANLDALEVALAEGRIDWSR